MSGLVQDVVEMEHKRFANWNVHNQINLREVIKMKTYVFSDESKRLFSKLGLLRHLKIVAGRCDA